MRILLIGTGNYYHIGTFFRSAIESLGHECIFIDEAEYFRLNTFVEKIIYRLRRKRPLNFTKFNHDILTTCQAQPEVVLVVKGAYISPDTLRKVRESNPAIIVNYATDDPFNNAVSTPAMIKSIPYYDLYLSTKKQIIPDLQKAGARAVEFIPFGYEPSLHYPEEPASDWEYQKYFCDVGFIGGADQDRVQLFEKVISNRQHVLHLYGAGWHKQPRFKAFDYGIALGRGYRLAINTARVSLGLVRRRNRDGHSMRSFEIPACGGFMLAERTEEHLELFREDIEAAYFSSTEELLDKLNYYLSHESARQKISKAGMKKVASIPCTYQDRMQQIIALLKTSYGF